MGMILTSFDCSFLARLLASLDESRLQDRE
jgi:hypothetical protein